MANWKKVIVSGSDAKLNEVSTSSHITSSGIISASGKLYGNLDENPDQTYVVVYNPTTGELEYKLLNLINATRAPELYLIDHDNDSDDTSPNFRFSFDSSSNTGNPITAPIVLSASIGGAYDHAISTNDATFASEININSTWGPTGITNTAYFDPDTSTNNTASQAEGHASGPGNGRFVLNLGSGTSQKESITLHLQSIDENTTATPSPAGTPYQAKGFDSPTPGDDGEIRVYVNTMELDSPTAVFNIGPTVGAVTTPSNNITPNISVSSSNLDGTDVDTLKCNRTGTVTIGTGAQVDGYNYAFLFYTGSRGNNQVRALTNFTEWFYDENGAGQAMVSALDGAADFSLSGNTHYISGIKYYDRSLTGTFKQRFTTTNQYRNIYPVSTGLRFLNVSTNTFDTLSITQSGDYLSSSPYKQSLDASDNDQEVGLSPLTADVNAHTQQTNITASATLEFNNNTNYLHAPNDFFFETSDGSAPFNNYVSETIADANITFRATHVNKSNATDRTRNVQDYLINALTSGSDTEIQLESFRGEKYRVQNRSWAFNDDPTSYLWDSSADLDGANSLYNTGLLQYGSHLVYPNKAGESIDGGDFSSDYGPTQDNDYGGVTGTRTYYRYFKLGSSGTGIGEVAFQLEMKGKGKITPTSNALVTNDEFFHVQVMRLGNGSGAVGSSLFTSGLVDALATPQYQGVALSTNGGNYQYIPLTNNEGSISYSVTTVEGAFVTTSTIPLSDAAAATGLLANESILVKISVPQGWTGYLDSLGIRYGNYTAGSTSVLATNYGSTSH
jgi:hypothetical protein